MSWPKSIRIILVVVAVSFMAISLSTVDAYSYLPSVSTNSSPYVGIWKGWTIQTQPASQYNTVVNLVPGETETVIGTTAYPELACGGLLTLHESTSDHILLSEKLTYGSSRCYDNGLITLTLQISNTFDFDWHSLQVPAVATSTLELISEDGNQITEAFIGIWQGEGVQQNPSSSWTVQVGLSDGVQNAIVGSIAYPSLRCGGNLTLQASTTTVLTFSEDITFGNCIDTGTMTLTMQSNGTLLYEWQKGGTTASGALRRISNLKRLFLPIVTKS